MNHSEKQPTFEIQPIMEQKPFENAAVQSFFGEWCKINDSIRLHVMKREVWEEKSTEEGILEKTASGTQFLHVPQDLRLWEMVGVMEAVDRDTFSAKPERQREAKEKLLELGKTFQNAGIYIAQRLGSVKEGNEIARALAEEFYGYGQSLVSGEELTEFDSADSMASHLLTKKEVSVVDRFFAGDDFYDSKRARIKKDAGIQQVPEKELYEEERQKTLAKFFRIAEKAFFLEEKNRKGELRGDKTHLKPWQNDTPIHQAFIAKIEKAIAQKLETPKRELENSLFRRGMELLQQNMRFMLSPHLRELISQWQGGEVLLREALQIDKLKAELETVRQSGDVIKISAKEREITDKIQLVINDLPRSKWEFKPSEILTSKYIDCAGASTLGGALLREVGLNYLVGAVPNHSILFLVTSDGCIEWRDMLNPSFNEHITDNVIAGTKEDGSPLSVSDIVAFSKNPSPEGLMFDIKSMSYRDKLFGLKETQRQYVAVFEPEYGQRIQILNSTGILLFKRGRTEEAVEAYRRAIAFGPKWTYPYVGLGNVLVALGRPKEAEEAIGVFRRAIAIDPTYAFAYRGLGNAFRFLGRTEESVEAYQKFVALADKQTDMYLIKQVKGIITELQNKINK